MQLSQVLFTALNYHYCIEGQDFENCCYQFTCLLIFKYSNDVEHCAVFCDIRASCYAFALLCARDSCQFTFHNLVVKPRGLCIEFAVSVLHALMH